MSSGINLLPREFEPKGSVLRLSKALKLYVTVASLISFVLVILAESAFYMLGRRVKLTHQDNNLLKNEITALKETETALVLVQDRVLKIESVNKQAQVKEEIDTLAQIRSILTEGITISDTHLKEGIAEITLNASNLSDMTKFLNIATQTSNYRTINLISFEFKPGNGYKTTLGFIK